MVGINSVKIWNKLDELFKVHGTFCFCAVQSCIDFCVSKTQQYANLSNSGSIYVFNFIKKNCCGKSIVYAKCVHNYYINSNCDVDLENLENFCIHIWMNIIFIVFVKAPFKLFYLNFKVSLLDVKVN